MAIEIGPLNGHQMEPLNLSAEWAAGFFDGEGCTSLINKRFILVNITQKDRECLDRFQMAVGSGVVYGPDNRGFYKYKAYRRRALQVLGTLWPYLGTLKRQQALRCLAVDRTAKDSIEYATNRTLGTYLT